MSLPSFKEFLIMSGLPDPVIPPIGINNVNQQAQNPAQGLNRAVNQVAQNTLPSNNQFIEMDNASIEILMKSPLAQSNSEATGTTSKQAVSIRASIRQVNSSEFKAFQPPKSFVTRTKEVAEAQLIYNQRQPQFTQPAPATTFTSPVSIVPLVMTRTIGQPTYYNPMPTQTPYNQQYSPIQGNHFQMMGPFSNIQGQYHPINTQYFQPPFMQDQNTHFQMFPQMQNQQSNNTQFFQPISFNYHLHNQQTVGMVNPELYQETVEIISSKSSKIAEDLKTVLFKHIYKEKSDLWVQPNGSLTSWQFTADYGNMNGPGAMFFNNYDIFPQGPNQNKYFLDGIASNYVNGKARGESILLCRIKTENQEEKFTMEVNINAEQQVMTPTLQEIFTLRKVEQPELSNKFGNRHYIYLDNNSSDE